MSVSQPNKNVEVCTSQLSDFFDTELCYSPKEVEIEPESTIPSVNIKENDQEFKIELAAPGFNKNDFHVNVEDNVLTITVENKKEEKEEDELYTKKEFSYNSFYRSFMLPLSINSIAVNAKYADGILKLCIPKKEDAQAIPIKEIEVV